MIFKITNVPFCQDSGILVITESTWICASCFSRFPKDGSQILCRECREIVSKAKKENRHNYLFYMAIFSFRVFLIRLASQGIELKDSHGRRVV